MPMIIMMANRKTHFGQETNTTDSGNAVNVKHDSLKLYLFAKQNTHCFDFFRSK